MHRAFFRSIPFEKIIKLLNFKQLHLQFDNPKRYTKFNVYAVKNIRSVKIEENYFHKLTSIIRILVITLVNNKNKNLSCFAFIFLSVKLYRNKFILNLAAVDGTNSCWNNPFYNFTVVRSTNQIKKCCFYNLCTYYQKYFDGYIS